MITKRILNYERIRQIPKSFGWIDHRLITDGHISNWSREERDLYYLLMTVGDKFGLSFYGDEVIRRMLKISQQELDQVRGGLREKGYIEYRRPLYQVLELPHYKI